jgi:hypothetical protein
MQGDWLLDVQHPVPSLYTVALRDAGGAHELLHTALCRPESRAGSAPADAR